eukprot:2409698-Rhodomonas_salina.2
MVSDEATILWRRFKLTGLAFGPEDLAWTGRWLGFCEDCSLWQSTNRLNKLDDGVGKRKPGALVQELTLRPARMGER